MKKAKVITSNTELEKFLARTDIEIINVDIRSCCKMWWLLRLFCKCYKRSLIGYTLDEKLRVSSSTWKCNKCGKIHKTFEID